MKVLRQTVLLGALAAAAVSARAASLPVANFSFEEPPIDPIEIPFLAVPVAISWIEVDLDSYYSSNTGVFRNTEPNSFDHIVNAHGAQLAFLNTMSGNGFLQQIPSPFQVGRSYLLLVDVCPSTWYPPRAEEPVDYLSISFYTGADANDFITTLVPGSEIIPNYLRTFRLYLPTVQPTDPWAGKDIGIALRAVGEAGGYWDLDNVRVFEYVSSPDLTGDGIVNLADFAVLSSEWFQETALESDLTGDGFVDLEDLIFLTDMWLEML